jgi:hypothetical protein
MPASLHLLHLQIIDLPEIVHIPGQSVVLVSMAVAAMALSSVSFADYRRGIRATCLAVFWRNNP